MGADTTGAASDSRHDLPTDPGPSNPGPSNPGPSRDGGADDAAAGRGPTVGTAVFLLVLAWGAGIASYSLLDNSFLTHLATGRLILEDGSVPSTDPYTFTAPGVDWTVQSWLPSLIYAGAERAGGVVGLRVVVLVFFLCGAALLWRLSRSCTSLVPRLAIVFGSLYVVTNLWGERPYMFGVIGLGVVWLALDRDIPPWSMVPIYWVWANSHGSFPLGLGLVVLVVIGRKLDGDDVDHELRVLAWSVVGTLSAVIGPLGFEVLLFPLTALTRADVLRQIVEWQPAAYQSTAQRLFLVLVIVTVLALLRRPSWSHALPALAFIAAAVVAQRNIVMAVMVLVPVLAAAAPDLGELRVTWRPNLVRAYVLVGAIAVVAGLAYALSSPMGTLDAYPARALAWIDTTGAADERMAEQDIVGNLLEGLDGAAGEVFVDDRVDMLPTELVEDSLELLRGDPRWPEVLDRYEIELVVWERNRPLATFLAQDQAWRVVYSDTQWMLACRRGPTCDAID